MALGQHSARMADGARPAMYAAVGEALRRLLGAVSWVASALESGDIEVKTGALVAAAALREPRLAPLVAEVAQEERLVPEVMRTLACFGPETGRELLASMDRLSFPAREAAGQVLVDMVDESFVPELVQMLDWGEVDLKGVAARALGRTGALEAVEPLADFLSNPELAGVAARALVALSAGFRARVLQALQASLEQGAQPVVLNALVRVGGTAQLPLVRRIAREASVPLRATAVEVLAAVDPSGGLELARVALVDEAPRVRAAAVRVLGRWGMSPWRRCCNGPWRMRRWRCGSPPWRRWASAARWRSRRTWRPWCGIRTEPSPSGRCAPWRGWACCATRSSNTRWHMRTTRW
ncbi:HEAT repeat domain-containing protein [Cystobacter fuscus]